MTHVVGGQGRRRHPGTVGVGRRHPSVTVYVVVVRPFVARAVVYAHIGAIGRYVPDEGRSVDAHRETQVLCCIVHLASAIEPYRLQIQRQIDLVARVGIVAIHPDFIVGGVDALHPYLVDQHIRRQLVFVAGINHHLVLRVQVAYRPHSLAVREVMHTPCRHAQTHQSHHY